MRAKSLLQGRVVALGALLLVSGCGDSYRRSMDGGFPDGGGIGVVDNTAVGQASSNAYESSLRSAMGYYHMAEDDIDCMVELALPDDVADPQLSWTADELNAFASECDVDFSGMYYMTD